VRWEIQCQPEHQPNKNAGREQLVRRHIRKRKRYYYDFLAVYLLSPRGFLATPVIALPSTVPS
jgi:hypothetical protein